MVHALYLSLGMKYDLRDELKKVSMPVLVLHGEKDMMPVKASQEYAALLSKGEICMISKVTHFPFVEKPKEFARIVRDFFQINRDSRNQFCSFFRYNIWKHFQNYGLMG